jgi:hypothetical protein
MKSTRTLTLECLETRELMRADVAFDGTAAMVDRPAAEPASAIVQMTTDPGRVLACQAIDRPVGKLIHFVNGQQFVFDSTTTGRLFTSDGGEQKFRDLDTWSRDSRSMAFVKGSGWLWGGSAEDRLIPVGKVEIGAFHVDEFFREDGYSVTCTEVVLFGTPVRGEPEIGGFCVPEPTAPAARGAEAEPPSSGTEFLPPFVSPVLLHPILPLPVGKPYQNYRQPTDVNGDGAVTPLDALLLVNKFHRDSGSDSLPGSTPTAAVLPDVSSATETGYRDVNNDDRFTPLDLLQVVNELLAHSDSPSAGDDSRLSYHEDHFFEVLEEDARGV